MKRVITIAFLGVFLVGCSGRVQTNPLPDDSKIYLPNGSSFSYQNRISQKQKNDFNSFAYRVLKNKENVEINDIDEDLDTTNNVILVQDFGVQNGKPKPQPKQEPKIIWDKGLESNYE